MPDSTAILLLFVVPLAGLCLLPLLPDKPLVMPRIVTIIAMAAMLYVAISLFLPYDGTTGQGGAGVNITWIGSLGINLHLAIDGLNIYLLLLTAILFPVVLACSWYSDQAKSRLFLALLLVLETALLGTFLSQNLMLFFIFWEAVLIPGSILILVFGGDRRHQAAMTFFLYTLAGSILLLAAVILLGVESLHQTGRWSFEFETLYRLRLEWHSQLFVFGAVLLACAIKCPLFPFHSWLPLVYFEAPFSGTALMAGVLSKMGIFGLLKLALPLCPDVAPAAAPFVVMLAVISILYGAVLALKQKDFKRLIAWSSLSHMGYIVLGVFSLQQTAIQGALFQVLSHGVAVAGLFLILNLLEQRIGISYRRLTALGSHAPRLAVLMMLFIVTSIALPLTSGFTSEFLILFGAFQQGMTLWKAGSGMAILFSVILASSGMVLGAGYMLRFGRAILFGRKNGSLSLPDLNLREALSFAPLLLLIFWIGIWPYPLMTRTQTAVTNLVAGDNPPLLLATHPVYDKGVANGR